MAEYPNFYESLNEALMRIKGCVVLYDGHPQYIWTVTDNPDGHFRVYMTSLEKMEKFPGNLPCQGSLPHGHEAMAGLMNEWMSANKGWVERKKMNSPAFNRFRPFPLGMYNPTGFTNAIYCERQPLRPKTEQGLLSSMIYTTLVSPAANSGGVHIDMFNQKFVDCILGNHPSPKAVLEGLQNPKHMNESVGFHREFALVKGPIDIMFLGYKENIIGVLPNGDFSKIRLSVDYKHCKEVVEELNLFYSIEVK